MSRYSFPSSATRVQINAELIKKARVIDDVNAELEASEGESKYEYKVDDKLTKAIGDVATIEIKLLTTNSGEDYNRAVVTTKSGKVYRGFRLFGVGGASEKEVIPARILTSDEMKLTSFGRCYSNGKVKLENPQVDPVNGDCVVLPRKYLNIEKLMSK